MERNHELIKEITDAAAVRPKLYPEVKDFEFVKQFQQQPYITIAPASVWFTKQYPKEKWISFIEKIPYKLSVLLIGAPSDKVLCEEIIEEVRRQKSGVSSEESSVGNLAGKLCFFTICCTDEGSCNELRK